MDSWKERFEEIICEMNGLESPSQKRAKEIEELERQQVSDMMLIAEEIRSFKPDTTLEDKIGSGVYGFWEDVLSYED